MGIWERDAQLLRHNLRDNLHNRRVNCTNPHAIPHALATLSTIAAAINSSFDPFSFMFGPPNQ